MHASKKINCVCKIRSLSFGHHA